MGNQQLLFIVLGILAVSIAVLAGLDYFQAKAVQNNRDQVILELNQLAGMARSYYKKSTNLSGGGRSYIGFGIPEDLKLTASGEYKILNSTSSRLLIEGVGNESSGAGIGCDNTSRKITYQLSITPKETILNKVY